MLEYIHEKGDSMVARKILREEELVRFCKELNINCNMKSILIMINKKQAEYYSIDDDCFHKLDLKIAKKYI